MNIVICDDIPSEAAKLSAVLKGLGHSPAAFTSSADALGHIRSGAAADVCVLDIIMPGMNGIELAARLRKDGFTGEIIFLSNSDQYGPQTYGVKAFNYLLKPVSPASFKRVLNEIKAAREKTDNGGITLKISGTARFVLFRNILFAEVVRNNVTFRFAGGGSMEIRSPLSEIAPRLLCDDRFIRCHRSYIVNMDAISSIVGREITMCCGTKIPVSKTYADVKRKYIYRGLGAERI